MRFKINEMLFHCLNNFNVYEVICNTIIKLLLRNLLASVKKLFCYPHDHVTVRKSISFSFLQEQVDNKTFHAGGHRMMC